ncbi:ATP-binding protein [Conexibacter sp. SYSU D00693]|uniref:ATP-binding protein n=1 Tax=Conexibacter sp. SYSU D00693 TaxID=2812560 RepID=UPI00196B7533|nr:ATP-binding protein [Conexibacter sp. SYSU D00693]
MRRTASLPPDPTALRLARDAVDAFRDSLSEVRWRDARIAVSELVANAVRHVEHREGDTLDLALELDDHSLRVELADGGPGFDRAPTSRGDEHGGWGLYIVDLVARDWGVDREPRTRVWFVLDVADGDGAGAAQQA